MNHTSCGKNCAFVKSGFCESDRECPFFTEAWWKEEGKDLPVLISDCFCKRSTIEQNNLSNRVLANQSELVTVRNKLHNIEGLLSHLIAQSQQVIEENKKGLDFSSNPLKIDHSES